MAAVNSFSTAAGKDEPIVDEYVDDIGDEFCAEEFAIVDEAICANKSVGETENNEAADNKSCDDVESCADVKSCADETANVDELGDESTFLENPVGNANDWLGDDNVPLAPPLLHGSCTVHGSTRTPELSTPNCREPTLVS